MARSADIGVTVLAAWLGWARLRGHVAINAAAGIPNLYRGGDRAEIVWTAGDIARFTAIAVKKGRPQVVDGLRLAAATGLRRQDLVSLTWSQVGELAIVKTALKRSGGKRFRATIPLTPTLQQLLDELRTRDRKDGVETVLVNSRGRAWTGDGFATSFDEVRNAAAIVHTDDEGAERKKHLHDVRGTFCTMLLTECDLTDKEAAEIMGWSPERVGKIRRVYVDDNKVVVALGAKIAAKQYAKQSASGSGN
jgi:integrase